MIASRFSLFWFAFTCIQWGLLSALQLRKPKFVRYRSQTSTSLLGHCSKKSSFETYIQENNGFFESIRQPILAFAAILSAGIVFINPQSIMASSVDSNASTFTLSQAATAPADKWDSVRFLEEQDNGRLVRVTYSPDGKTASGTDVDGNRFIASLQAEQNGLPLIVAPIALLGIGAFAFSKSSEGQAIKAVAGLDQDVNSLASLMVSINSTDIFQNLPSLSY